jgi:hypothetical protein
MAPSKQVLLPLALTPVFLFLVVTEVPAPRAGIAAVVVGLLAGVVLLEGLRYLNVVGVDERLVTFLAIALLVGGVGGAYGLAPAPKDSLAALGILGTVWGITLEGLRIQLAHDPDGPQEA